MFSLAPDSLMYGQCEEGGYGESSFGPHPAAVFAYPLPFSTSAKLPASQGRTGLLAFLFPVGSFVIESPAVPRCLCPSGSGRLGLRCGRQPRAPHLRWAEAAASCSGGSCLPASGAGCERVNPAPLPVSPLGFI